MRYALITADATLTVQDRPGDPERILRGAVGGHPAQVPLRGAIDAWVSADAHDRDLAVNPLGGAVAATLGCRPERLPLLGPVALTAHLRGQAGGLSDTQLARVHAAVDRLHPAAGPPAEPARLTGGQLRELVAEHLHAHPDLELTPSQIANVLHRSRGAVANALDRLVTLGRAERTNRQPARYRAAARG